MCAFMNMFYYIIPAGVRWNRLVQGRTRANTNNENNDGSRYNKKNGLDGKLVILGKVGLSFFRNHNRLFFCFSFILLVFDGSRVPRSWSCYTKMDFCGLVRLD